MKNKYLRNLGLASLLTFVSQPCYQETINPEFDNFRIKAEKTFTNNYLEDLFLFFERRRLSESPAGIVGYVSAPEDWLPERVLYEFSQTHDLILEKDYLVQPYISSDGEFLFFGIFDLEEVIANLPRTDEVMSDWSE